MEACLQQQDIGRNKVSYPSAQFDQSIPVRI